ncbi:hypothetical protein [Ewingella americana]|uniref:Uncharacterized protein n=1 Tax=Ewingella americana TaxID=41202 RepID=A0A502GES4_9GAMM|nr:hypothetical protein [Ewingella americana]TPG60122.1 hypothetical protein EAH77_16265 [Ewingella americana]
MTKEKKENSFFEDLKSSLEEAVAIEKGEIEIPEDRIHRHELIEDLDLNPDGKKFVKDYKG